MKKAAFSLLISLLFSAALGTASAAQAPDFSFTDSNGVSKSLSDFKGQHVVLEWFNPDCPFVRKHYDSGNMQGLQKEFTGKGVAWISIDSSAPGKQGHYSDSEHNSMMSAKGGSPTHIVADPAGKIGRLYDAKTTPHMFVVNPDGDLVYQGAIDSNPSANPGDIAGAENYVADALNASMSGQDVPVGKTRSYGCSVKY